MLFHLRSIVVDFFPHDKEAAMPCIYLFNALTVVVGFLWFPYLGVEWQATVVIVTSIFGLVTYSIAARDYTVERNSAMLLRKELDGNSSMYVRMDDGKPLRGEEILNS